MATLQLGYTFSPGEVVTPAKLDMVATLVAGTVAPTDLTPGAPSWDSNGDLTAAGVLSAASLGGALAGTNAAAMAAFNPSSAKLTSVAMTYSGTLISASKVAHGLNTGDWITIFSGTGATANFNGTWPVTVTSANTFTFSVTTAPTAGLTADLYPVHNLGALNITGIGPVSTTSSGQYNITSPALIAPASGVPGSVVLGCGPASVEPQTPTTGAILVKAYNSAGTLTDFSYTTLLIFNP